MKLFIFSFCNKKKKQFSWGCSSVLVQDESEKVSHECRNSLILPSAPDAETYQEGKGDIRAEIILGLERNSITDERRLT